MNALGVGQMARARNIKPSFFQNDGLGEQDPLARLAFIGMWTIADFKGRIEYRPKMMKVQILPYDKCDIELIVNNLEKAGFIRFYSVNGKRYIKIVSFERHQNPHKNEREAGSDIPDINDEPEINNENNDINKDGTKTEQSPIKSEPLVLIPDSLLLIPDSLNKDLPKASFDRDKKISHDVLFDAFWKAYPKKEAKGAAEKAWAKMRDKGKTLTLILEALRWQTSSQSWTQDNGKYIKNPATYLNAKCWLDEMPSATNEGKPHETNRAAHQSKPSLCERATNARKETERRLTENEAHSESVGKTGPHLRPQMVGGNGRGGRNK